MVKHLLCLLSLSVLVSVSSGSRYPPNAANCSIAQKVAAQSAVPIGVVWLERENESLSDIFADFQAIKAAGFNNLKQLMFRTTLAMSPGDANARMAAVYNLALDAGVIPWWYGVGGWECITEALLGALGIPLETPMAAVQADPRMLAYQDGVLRARVAAMAAAPVVSGLGEPGRGSPLVTTPFLGNFSDWLNATYGGNVTALQVAWEYPYRNLSQSEFTNFSGAAALPSTVTVSIPCQWTYCVSGVSWDFRRYRDSMRFQADFLYADIGAQLAALKAYDPQEPQRTGGQHVLDNYAGNGWDMLAQAALAADAGSLYISLHVPWHYNLANGEIDRPLFHQAKLTADALRGGWAGEWESTGGPTMYSGGLGGAVDAPQMRRLLLGYLAAGMKGAGLWSWNGRDRGQEAMEYQLVNLQGVCAERCRAAGAVSAAAERWRFELWSASEAPIAAILTSWENEAIFARLSLVGPPLPCTISNCHDFTAAMPWEPVKGRMGAARVLGDARIPYAFLDERLVRAGALSAANASAPGSVASSLRILVIPHMLGLSADILPAIRDWQLRGGRVVADQPFNLFDTSVPAGTGGRAEGRPLDSWGTTVDQSRSLSYEIFGAFVTDYQSTTNGNADRSVCLAPPGAPTPPPGTPLAECAATQPVLSGLVGELALNASTSSVRAWMYAPGGDRALPAVVFNGVAGGASNGSAALLNFEAFRYAWASDAFPTPHDPTSGQSASVAAVLVDAITDSGAILPPWAATQSPPPSTGGPGPVNVHRRLALADDGSRLADHYFIVNTEAFAVSVAVTLAENGQAGYASAQNAITGAAVALAQQGAGFDVVVPSRDAMWVRALLA